MQGEVKKRQAAALAAMPGMGCITEANSAGGAGETVPCEAKLATFSASQSSRRRQGTAVDIATYENGEPSPHSADGRPGEGGHAAATNLLHGGRIVYP